MSLPDVSTSFNIPGTLHRRIVMANANVTLYRGTKTPQKEFLVELIELGVQAIENNPEIKKLVESAADEVNSKQSHE